MELSGYLYISKSAIHGEGLFCSVFIKEGTQIMLVADNINIHKGGDEFITPFGRKVNHAKNGNTKIRFDGKLYWLDSIKDIDPGEELTSDYSVLKYPFKNKIDGYIEK